MVAPPTTHRSSSCQPRIWRRQHQRSCSAGKGLQERAVGCGGTAREGLSHVAMARRDQLWIGSEGAGLECPDRDDDSPRAAAAIAGCERSGRTTVSGAIKLGGCSTISGATECACRTTIGGAIHHVPVRRRCGSVGRRRFACTFPCQPVRTRCRAASKPLIDCHGTQLMVCTDLVRRSLYASQLSFKTACSEVRSVPDGNPTFVGIGPTVQNPEMRS